MRNDELRILVRYFLSSVHHSSFHGHRSRSSHQTGDIVVEDQHDEGGNDQEPHAPGHLPRADTERAAEQEFDEKKQEMTTVKDGDGQKIKYRQVHINYRGEAE